MQLSGFIPRSLFGRMLVVMLFGVLLAQVLSNLLWVEQFKRDKEQVAQQVAFNLSQSVASTINFFKALPSEYRHIVLSQLRDMGGTRYFVSLNKEVIHVNDIENTHLMSLVSSHFSQGLQDKLGKDVEIKVDFSHAEDLRVFNNDTLLLDLPPRWSQHSLIYSSPVPEILVAQVLIGEGEIIRLHAHPTQQMLLKTEGMSSELMRPQAESENL